MKRLILIIVALLLLSSCSAHDFVGGRPVTPEDLESISAGIFETVDEPDAAETDKGGIGIHSTVYWTPDGKTYHASRRCPRLNGQYTVKDSTLMTAEGKGLRPCSDCCP